jgi:catechol 2,3-dioxygenase-like lactoylglutathione lyase family enzyme/predicted enzyme related to lactoylglutathione lyase
METTMTIDQNTTAQALDHSVVPVMDLWRAERFYTETLDGFMFHKVGLTFDWASGAKGTGNLGTFVKLGAHHLGLFLQKVTPVYPAAAPEQSYPCWGLAVAEEAFDTLAAEVAAAGGSVGAKRSERYGRAERRAVRCTDSEGNGLELVAVPNGGDAGPRVLGLSHLRLEARDPAASAAFYGGILGLELVGEGPDWLALALPSGQHLFFHHAETLSPATVGPYIGRHFAFQVSRPAFAAIVERLRAAGVAESDVNLERTSDEAETYFHDPDGHWLQITTESSAKAAIKHPARLRYAAP